MFRQLGGTSPSPAAAFVLATGIAFIFLSLKYVDVAARYPDGGGVVSVASDAFGPFIGCIGGILICVDYFLTGAISSVMGAGDRTHDAAGRQGYKGAWFPSTPASNG